MLEVYSVDGADDRRNEKDGTPRRNALHLEVLLTAQYGTVHIERALQGLTLRISKVPVAFTVIFDIGETRNKDL